MRTTVWYEILHIITRYALCVFIIIKYFIFYTNIFFLFFKIVFRDLLAVIASTDRKMFRFHLGTDIVMSQLHDFLQKNLSYDNISTALDVDDASIFLILKL